MFSNSLLLLSCAFTGILFAPYPVDGAPPTYPSDNPPQYPTGGAAPRSLNIPGSVPKNAGPVLDPRFTAFAFEARSLLFYAGDGQSAQPPNQFSQNLIEAITSRTNVKPIVRAGGTSLDHSNYDPNQTEAVTYPEGQDDVNIPYGLVFGPSYFKAHQNFDADYIIDVPLALNNLSGTLLFAKDAYNGIGPERITALECGNEPSSYKINGDRPGYTIQQYIKDWTNFTTRVSQELGLSTSEPNWRSLGLATPPRYGWSVLRVFKGGLVKVKSRITEISQHYYQSLSGEDLQSALMNHTATVAETAFMQPGIDYARSIGLPYVIGETGSALNTFNDEELEGVLGSALWHVDYLMHSMARGVSRVHYQSGIGFAFSMWQPTEYNGTEARVRSPFYGHIFGADFVGPSGATRVVNFDQKSDLLAAYAAYDGNVLKRIAIVNLELWTQEENGNPRPQVEYTVAVPPGNANSVKVKRLMSPEGGRAMEETSISYAGQQWTYASGGTARQVDDGSLQTVPIKDGKVTVKLPASEAVMICLEG